MSRIGKKPISIPEKTEIKIEDQQISVRGLRGELKQTLPKFLKIEIKENQLNIFVENPEEKNQRSCWGTFNVLISNMIHGVNQGFEKKLELVGVGYRAKTDNDKLILNIGFSHPVEFILPVGIKAIVEQNIITIQGIDKQLVGEIAAQIRKLKKPEPYKGKGIKYIDEIIRRKSGKKAATSSS
ncbi:MAG: 50S ribosomal protein L6 [Patescibacteria group bacterium]|nr:50S ribosomal protein L6 [Patescibacteria group bacterium]MDD5172926.1 50S ribosomal protein L6 [Patescibacteria group bacterium]